MQKDINIRTIENGEEYLVGELIVDCFNKYIATDYSTEGIKEFLKYVDGNRIRERVSNNYFMLIAMNRDRIVGTIEVKDFNHISLLFAGDGYKKIGIAHKLIDEAILKCQYYNKGIQCISANSAPCSIKFYNDLGFNSVEEEKTVHGIRFTLMELEVK
ncbi:GNAT family N-acetyltransferase [Inconstantimicrobium mannanitabidum]|uniref:Uncharacterized protein n=1 Tax=Inconstantimicrobium mannanitabidum TaxID=1604901 RepID=A0ACB5R7Z7_9CLOT|nr:GNAT family N-acetyltransferase [Clostridium sp. TW13]GKX65086.1 hypothetical protein rsdtw13_03440 [Clostridium sp. TW13]